jgi:hypothetical protein
MTLNCRSSTRADLLAVRVRPPPPPTHGPSGYQIGTRAGTTISGQ